MALMIQGGLLVPQRKSTLASQGVAMPRVTPQTTGKASGPDSFPGTNVVLGDVGGAALPFFFGDTVAGFAGLNIPTPVPSYELSLSFPIPTTKQTKWVAFSASSILYSGATANQVGSFVPAMLDFLDDAGGNIWSYPVINTLGGFSAAMAQENWSRDGACAGLTAQYGNVSGSDMAPPGVNFLYRKVAVPGSITSGFANNLVIPLRCDFDFRTVRLRWTIQAFNLTGTGTAIVNICGMGLAVFSI